MLRALLVALAALVAPVGPIAPVGPVDPVGPVGAPVYTPQLGQSGKDVIWVPTPDALVDRMLTMAQVGPGDQVVDLGSGDGRLVLLAASKFGASARGIEYNPELVALSRQRARAAGLTQKVRFEQGDLFRLDFRAATVVTLYLLPALNRRLRPTLLAMRPGTRVVSHQFTMDDWAPDETSYFEQRAAYLWIVPAQVAGGWDLTTLDGTRFNFDIEQEFQRIKGRAEFHTRLGTIKAGLREPSLRGDEIRFSIVDPQGRLLAFTGKLVDGHLEGAVHDPGPAPGTWIAVRRPA